MSTRLVGSSILGCAYLALLAGHSQARPIEHWPYDKLFKHADLVVIVRPLSVRDATAKDKAVPPKDGLFLKTGKDRRLEFVSGQFDPELSVKQLLRPLR